VDLELDPLAGSYWNRLAGVKSSVVHEEALAVVPFDETVAEWATEPSKLPECQDQMEPPERKSQYIAAQGPRAC
jgi:hypothetical protein